MLPKETADHFTGIQCLVRKHWRFWTGEKLETKSAAKLNTPSNYDTWTSKEFNQSFTCSDQKWGKGWKVLPIPIWQNLWVTILQPCYLVIKVVKGCRGRKKGTLKIIWCAVTITDSKQLILLIFKLAATTAKALPVNLWSTTKPRQSRCSSKNFKTLFSRP